MTTIRGYLHTASLLVLFAHGFGLNPKVCHAQAPIVTGAGLPTAAQLALLESPVPQDRLYLSSNFFNSLAVGFTPGFGEFDFYRQTLGIEKTFLNGTASLGLRLPLDTISASSGPGAPGIGDTELGDLSLSGKFAFAWNESSGSLLSGGLLITAPTHTGNLYPDTVLFEPFLGYIFNSTGKVYVHGFSSVLVPTDSNYATSLLNDIGVGYVLYRRGPACDRWITAVVPTVEAHVTTPLEKREIMTDIVNLTAGVIIGLGKRSSFGIAFDTPITQPHPYDFQTVAYLDVTY